MIKSKKKLKESGKKPTKQKIKPVEQHFDDCGEDVSSLIGVSTSPETYRDTFYDDDYGIDSNFRGREAHSRVFFGLERDFECSNVVNALFQKSFTLVAQNFRDLSASIDLTQSYVTSLHGVSSYVDILEVMGGKLTQLRY